MKSRFVAFTRALFLSVIVWAASSIGAPFVLAQTTPSATVKVWNITSTIGHNPDESVEDIAGITGHVATAANPQTIAATIENTTHPEGPCGLIFWNPATNAFKWYGVTGGFSAGIDLNLRAPVLSGPSGSVFGAPTFQPGDVWVSVNSNPTTPLYVNLKGSNNFRHYPVSSSGVNGVQVQQTTGHIYFTEPSAGNIGRLDPATNAVTKWTIGGTPHYLSFDSLGRVYSAVAGATVAGGVDAIVRVDPAATVNNVTSWPVPGGGLTSGVPFQTPDGVAFDRAGNLWFAESTSSQIGRLNPSTGEICEFSKAGLVNPQLVASSGSGSLLQTFFTEGAGNAVSIITQAQATPIATPCPTVTPLTTTRFPSGFSTTFFDSIRTPRTATITPVGSSVAGVDGTPGIIRFPMPTPIGGNAGAPSFPSGMTGVVLPTTVFGSYLDPSFAGNSAVFEVSSSVIVAPPPSPRPSITSVLPTSGIQGQTIGNFTVNGNNFDTGAVLSFSGTGIKVNSYSLPRTATQIVASISIAFAAAPSARDVNVTNRDSQQGTLSGAFSVDLAPLGDHPDISVSPVLLDFGTVPVHSSITKGLSIQNTGTAPLSVTDITSTNSSFTSSSPTDFGPIDPGHGIIISVTFSPEIVGTTSGIFKITSNAPTSGIFVSLTGVGSTPQGRLTLVSSNDPAQNHPLFISANYIKRTGKEILADVTITNVTGTWYEVDIDFANPPTGPPFPIAVTEQQIPFAFLLGPFQQTTFKNMVFQDGQYLHFNATRTSVVSFAVLAIDLIGRGIFGRKLTDFSGSGFIGLSLGAIPALFSTIQANCSGQALALGTCAGLLRVPCVVEKAARFMQCSVENDQLRMAIGNLMADLYNNEISTNWIQFGAESLADLFFLFARVPLLAELADQTFMAATGGFVRLEARRP